MMGSTRHVGLLAMVFGLLPAACGQQDAWLSQALDASGSTAADLPRQAGARISTALKMTHRRGQDTPMGLRSTAMSDAHGADLQRLEYFIWSISICQSMEVQGSGFSGPKNCIELYKGPDQPLLRGGDGFVAPDYVTLAKYARTLDSNSGYIDLMDPDSRSQLEAETYLHPEQAGDYNYGMVSWAYPVRIQATLRDAANNATLFTKEGDVHINSNGYPYTVARAPFTSGPSELATVPLGNGGSWFKFQHPFRIRAEDIAANKSYALDLTFNPDGLVYGYRSVPQAGMGIYEDADPDGSRSVNSIAVPFLDLTPVPHGSEEVVIKETYLGSVTQGTDTRMDVRIELYAIEGDDTRTIYGVSTAGLVNSDSFGSNLPVGKAAFISTADDGTVTLEDWGHHAFLTGLKRLSTVGDTTEVQMSCTMSGSTSPLYGNCTGDSFPLTLTLKALTAVD